MTDTLQKLVNLCKCGVEVTINDHKNVYETADEWLNDQEWPPKQPDGLDNKVRERMIETNTVIFCQFYPDTPVGYYLVFHYDLESCLKECIDLIEEERNDGVKGT